MMPDRSNFGSKLWYRGWLSFHILCCVAAMTSDVPQGFAGALAASTESYDCWCGRVVDQSSEETEPKSKRSLQQVHSVCLQAYKKKSKRQVKEPKFKQWWTAQADPEQEKWYQDHYDRQLENPAKRQKLNVPVFSTKSEEFVGFNRAVKIHWMPYSEYEDKMIPRQKSIPQIKRDWFAILKVGPAEKIGV